MVRKPRNMKIIHKIAALVIKDNAFIMVRKHGSDVWTSLGGRTEKAQTSGLVVNP